MAGPYPPDGRFVCPRQVSRSRDGGARFAALADPGRHRARAAHGRARHDRDEPGAAVGAAGPGLQQRGPAVDRDGVLAVVRQPAAVLRPGGRPHRPQGGLHHRPDRVRRRVGHRRRVGELRDAGHRARLPGRVRRDAGAGRAFPADHHVQRPEGARQGVRRLRRDRRRGRRGRPAARRRADRVPVVALVPLHQPVLRRRRRVPAGRCCSSGRPASPGGRLDVPGVVMVSGGVFCLVYGFSNAARHSWSASSTLGLPRRGRAAARRVRGLAGAAPTTRCCRRGWCSTATAAAPTWRS